LAGCGAQVRPGNRIAYPGRTTAQGVNGFDFGRRLQEKRVEDAENDLVNHVSETNKCQYIAH